MPLVAAAVQMTSGESLEENLATVEKLVRRAHARGAALVALPENFALMASSEREKFAHAEAIDSTGQVGPVLSRLANLCRELGIHLIAGGMPERGPDAAHVYNTCVLLGPDGAIRAAYRKIHLFDVAIPDGAVYRESATVSPGAAPVIAETPWGKLGLSVCYDLRFPELYRALSLAGARILVVPAAFTQHTGKDHWHVLLRARAIENQCFVIAPGQYGRHSEKRVTYGHSLIVDPWGTVLAEAGDGEGLAVAELDFDQLERVRREVPCLGHRRIG